MSSETAQNVAGDPSEHVDKEKSRRAIQLFNLWANIHQHPHIENDMHQAAVKEHGHHKPPRLSDVIRQRKRRAEPLEHVAVDAADSKQRENSPSTRRLKPVRADRGEETHNV